MPDIDPAALSRPSVTLSTPILKSITVSPATAQKPAKTSQIIPARIELEPIYQPLKAAIGLEKWPAYEQANAQFMQGRLNQTEYTGIIDPILDSPTGDKVRLHNKLLHAMLGNCTREMPDAGLAPWVSANSKPVTAAGAKPVTGDAAERKLKGEVMQLPARDRRRIKELVSNDYDPYEDMAGMFSDHHRGRSRLADTASATGGLNKMNLDLEIRKKYAQPLAVESGEFPDRSNIESRMLPICYQEGLVDGHSPDAADLITTAAETFIKEFLSAVFTKTRSNGPGDSGSAGFGAGPSWIQTHKYRRQLRREETALMRGEIARDKGGLLPIEAKAAGERGPMTMADIRLATELGDCGLGTFPTVVKSVVYSYRDGELEHWDDYSYFDGYAPTDLKMAKDDTANGLEADALTNGVNHADVMDIDDHWGWEGADDADGKMLDSVLDSCLAAI